MNFLSTSAPAPIFVPPSNERALVYAFSTLDISACVGMLGLLVLGACTKRARANPALLHFHFGFFLTAFGETMMIWTGNAFNLNPPSNLCLVNSAFVSMSPTIKGGVAFALTCKVWAHTMTVAYPNSRVLRFMSSPWPIAVTWICALPLFLATIVTGLHERSSIKRSSIFYCLSQNRSLSMLNYGLSAVLEILTLVLAGWTALLVTRVRRRLRSAVHSKSPIHYSLIIRTLLFSVALTIALVITLVVALLNITAPISGMTIACLDFLGLLVFASDPVLLRSMVRRVRGDEDTSFATGPSANNPQTTGVSIQISRSGPVHDEAWNTDKVGSHALSVLPTSTRNTPVIIQKVDHAGEYSWDDTKQDGIIMESFGDDKP